MDQVTTQLLPVISLRDIVIYPHNELVLTFGRQKSKNAILSAMKSNKQVALFLEKSKASEDPTEQDLYEVGTLCQIERTLNTEGELNALVRGIKRIKRISIIQKPALNLVEYLEIPDVAELTPELEALAHHLTEQFRVAVGLGKSVEFTHFMRLVSGVSVVELADQIAATLTANLETKQKLLEEPSLKKRLYTITELLAREIKILEIEKNIANKTQQKFSKNMREAVLRERMNAIRAELGESDEIELEHNELFQRLAKLKLDKERHAKILKELERLDRMSPNHSEYHYLRTWLETVLELPWNKVTSDKVSLKTAEQVLNSDHYGLEEVKERILEYLSVMKLKQKQLGAKELALPTILCFVGPPGVGKTSLGRSIAKALRRKFVKVSLGGIRDEAEIRGHRKTYVGAMPGRIIDGIKSAKSSNPVFMLDEIDKIGNDFRGDPSAALLEALDPEQNSAFSDHYLELDYDLSRVMFIATANTLDTIPSALKDRLEVIRFSGYTPMEKLRIAQDYLKHKVMEKNALNPKDLVIKDALVRTIIHNYTREAGVRALERELSRLARKVARSKAKAKKFNSIHLTPQALVDYLGPSKFLPTLAEKKNPVGQATGLAWTAVGGEILFIEVATMPGTGKLQITGQLGDVMKESAQAAFTYIRSHYQDFDLKPDFYKKKDIHIHVPEGAVPKDGPSAGITMTTAIVSALTKKPVKKHYGMTGEVTLRGNVLEIGGLKEKTIAAHAAGLKNIIIPDANKKDLTKIPIEISKDLTFHPVKHVSEVLALALV